mmetsp:Transcript_32895/g.101223  ORF Transcript_32895/g.101223 Transcript_32895/m.101223 type:complete len:242 (+) Transcript_32895:182-907(+)
MDPTMTACASTASPVSASASAHHRGSMPYRSKFASDSATTRWRRSASSSSSSPASAAARATTSRRARRVASMVLSPESQNCECATMRWSTFKRSPRFAGGAPHSTNVAASVSPEWPRISYSYFSSRPSRLSITSIAASSMRANLPSSIWNRYIDPEQSMRNNNFRVLRPSPSARGASRGSGEPRRLKTRRSPATPSTSRSSSSSPSARLLSHVRSRLLSRAASSAARSASTCGAMRSSMLL